MITNQKDSAGKDNHPIDIPGVLASARAFLSQVSLLVDEIDRLRAENAQQKMELDKMHYIIKTHEAASLSLPLLAAENTKSMQLKIAHYEKEIETMALTFKTALALKNRKIKDLEDELKQLREEEKNEEVNEEIVSERRDQLPIQRGVGEAANLLRDIPQFDVIRRLIRVNNQLLPEWLAQVGQANPQLYQIIKQDPASFAAILNERDAAPMGGGGGARAADLAPGVIEAASGRRENPGVGLLRDIPHFDVIRRLVRENRQLLPEWLAQVGQANPQLYQMIQQDPASFAAILSEPDA